MPVRISLRNVPMSMHSMVLTGDHRALSIRYKRKRSSASMGQRNTKKRSNHQVAAPSIALSEQVDGKLEIRYNHINID